MKTSHLPWATKEQASQQIDLQKLFDQYWTSNTLEIVLHGQS